MRGRFFPQATTPDNPQNNTISSPTEDEEASSASSSSNTESDNPQAPVSIPRTKSQTRRPGIVTTSARTPKSTVKPSKKANHIMRQLPKFYQSGDPYCLDPKVWDQIAKDMQTSSSTYPAQFGDQLSSITARCHQYKAHEWSQWGHTLSLIYLKGTLPEPFYTEYSKLIEGITQCAALELNNRHIDQIQNTMANFIEHYEEHYYQFKWSRLSAMRSTIHMLSHVADGIKWAGPMYVYSQWTMERFCGTSGRMAKSKVQANRNMSLTLLKQEIRNHIPYVIRWDRVDPQSYTNGSSNDTDDAGELWDRCVQYLDKEHNPQPPRPKRQDETNPRLRGPSHRYSLPSSDHKKLIQYFKKFKITVDHSDSDTDSDPPMSRGDVEPTNVNIRKIPTTVLSWGACETQDGLIARPFTQKRHRNTTRDASFVRFRTSEELVDIGGPKLVYNHHFGQLLRLISIHFGGNNHALAYVTRFRTQYEHPGLQVQCTPHTWLTNVIIIPVEDIMELCGVLHKTDGSQYFCANGTAIHHFDSSDSDD